MSHLHIDLGSIKVLAFLDFADQTEQLWLIYYLKNVLLFLYKFKFSEACTFLNIDFVPIKDPSFHFWTLLIKLSNFARSIPLSLLLPPPSNKQKLVYIPYFCEIYGHLFKSSLLFLYKFKFSEACILLNIDLGPIKVTSFLHFADETEKLWQILCPQQDESLHYLSTKQTNGLTKLISVKSMVICLKIPYYFYTNLNFQRPIYSFILIWHPLKFHHSCTLQIKLSNFDRSNSPRWVFTLSID